MTDETTPSTPPAEQAPKTTTTKDDGSQYAAYDTTYLRFVGGTHPTKAKASAAAKAAGLDEYEIRTV